MQATASIRSTILPVDPSINPDFPYPPLGVSDSYDKLGELALELVLGFLLAWWVMPTWPAVGFIAFMTWASAVYSVPRFGSRTVRQSPWLTKMLGVTFRGVVYPSTKFDLTWNLTSAQSFGLIDLVFIHLLLCSACTKTFADIPDMQGDREGGYRSFAGAGRNQDRSICRRVYYRAWDSRCGHHVPAGISGSVRTCCGSIFAPRFCRRIYPTPSLATPTGWLWRQTFLRVPLAFADAASVRSTHYHFALYNHRSISTTEQRRKVHDLACSIERRSNFMTQRWKPCCTVTAPDRAYTITPDCSTNQNHSDASRMYLRNVSVASQERLL